MKKLFRALGFAAGFLATPAFAGLVTIPGQGMWIPSMTEQGVSNRELYGNVGALTSANASGQIAYIGTVYQQASATGGCFSGTKNLSAITFLTNNNTNGSPVGTVKFSIQTPSTSAGPPGRPDGTILGGGNAFSTKAVNTMASGVEITSPTFASPAVVTCGQPISIVFSWSSAGTGSQFQVGGATNFLDPAGYGPGITQSTDGTTWTTVATPPNVQLVFDDASVGSLLGTTFFSNNNGAGTQTRTYNSSSNPKEYGCSFTPPMAMTVSGMGTYIGTAANTATMTMELTDDAGTPNVLATVNLDGHSWYQTGTNAGYGYVAFTPVTLTAGTKYHIGALATSATNITLYEIKVGTAAEMASNPFGANFIEANRNGAAWSADTTTTRPGCMLMVTQVDQ